MSYDLLADTPTIRAFDQTNFRSTTIDTVSVDTSSFDSASVDSSSFDTASIDAAFFDSSDAVHERRWIILAALCMSLLLVSIDNTILNVALPDISRALSATGGQLQWIVDSYVVVFAGLLLAAGTLSDRFGRRSALLAGVAVFGVGSLAASIADSASQLVACRAFMGLGAALILPGTLSIITNVFRDERERARAIAIWAAVFGLGIAVGPVTGGYLLEHFYWGSVFIVNMPVLLVAVAATVLIVPNSKDPTAPRIDIFGVLASIVGLTSLVWTIIEAPERGWTDRVIIGGFTVTAVTVVLFVVWERRVDEPMIDTSLFKNRRFTVASSSIALTYFALFGSAFLLTQYLQFVRGYTALEAGIRYLPLAGTMMVVAPMSARFVERFGARLVIAGGMLLCCVGLLLTLRLDATSPYTDVALSLVVLAAGAGFAMAPATESIMGAIPPEKAGVGSAVNDTTREVGGALGVAILGSILASAYRNRMKKGTAPELPEGVNEVVMDSIGGASAVAQQLGSQGVDLFSNAQRAFVDGMHNAMGLGAVIVMLAVVSVVLFLPARGSEERNS